VKFVNRKAQAYIRDECDKLHNLGPRMNPDLKAMAMNGSKKDTLQVRWSTRKFTGFTTKKWLL